MACWPVRPLSSHLVKVSASLLPYALWHQSETEADRLRVADAKAW